MNYFKYLPKVAYDIKGTSSPYYTEATNIMVRQKVIDAIKNKIVTLYPYRVEDGDRPDIIATLYYGSPSFTWLIFMINDIKDPYYDWPLTTIEWESFMKAKYGTLEAAQTTVHEYYQIIRAATTNDAMVDDDSAINSEVRYIVDSTTYDSLASDSKGVLYKYDWEFDMNEGKRSIKLIDDAFATQVMSEARKAR